MLNFGNESFKFNQGFSDELKLFLNKNQTCNRAHSVIEKFVLSNVQTQDATEYLSNYVQEYFVPFCFSVLKQIHINGWCAYRIKEKIPKVIASEFLQVYLEKDIDNFSYTFKVCDLFGKELDDVDILIFDEIENYANNNLINSVMSGLIGDLRYESQLRAFSLQAEYVRSNPTVFLQGNADEVDRSNRNEASTVLNRINIDSQMSNTMSARIQRASTTNADTLSKASTDIAKNLEFHAEQMQSIAQKDYKRHTNLGLGFAPQYLNNIYIVPPGLNMPFQPHLPQSRQDYIQIDRTLSSKIGQAFGIPDSMLGLHVRSTYRETNSAQQEKLSPVNAVTFQSTLDKYSSFFQETFVTIYKNVFKTTLKKNSIEFNLPELWVEITKQVEEEEQNKQNIKRKRERERERENQIEESELKKR